MRPLSEDRSAFATVRPALEGLVDGIAFAPERAAGARAAEVLARDGAVIMDGYPVEQHSLVRAAADVLGTRLGPARHRDDAERLSPHRVHPCRAPHHQRELGDAAPPSRRRTTHTLTLRTIDAR